MSLQKVMVIRPVVVEIFPKQGTDPVPNTGIRNTFLSLRPVEKLTGFAIL